MVHPAAVRLAAVRTALVPAERVAVDRIPAPAGPVPPAVASARLRAVPAVAVERLARIPVAGLDAVTLRAVAAPAAALRVMAAPVVERLVTLGRVTTPVPGLVILGVGKLEDGQPATGQAVLVVPVTAMNGPVRVVTTVMHRGVTIARVL